ncbi:MAG: hypothetical protein H0U71_06410 [Gammaproteobacteria bacterium]|nr:hypothetical protein [Gammaproteobacteria bacterium]
MTPLPKDVTNTNLQSRELSWQAIIAGALVALSLSFLIHTLNAGLGLSAFTTSSTGMLALGIGAMLWLILTGIVTMFVAGFVAGRLARRLNADPVSGVLHGFLAWSLALVIGLVLATSVISGVVSSSQQAGNAVQHITQQAASDRDKALTPSKSTENVANSAGVTALATFFVFLFGAAASGVGGYYGATGYRKW